MWTNSHYTRFSYSWCSIKIDCFEILKTIITKQRLHFFQLFFYFAHIWKFTYFQVNLVCTPKISIQWETKKRVILLIGKFQVSKIVFFPCKIGLWLLLDSNVWSRISIWGCEGFLYFQKSTQLLLFNYVK